MSRKTRASDELLLQKILMSARAVSKDPRFALYAGGDYAQMIKLSRINVILKLDRFPTLKKLGLLETGKQFIDEERVATFGSWADILSQLGFIVGDERVKGDAARRDIPIRITP